MVTTTSAYSDSRYRVSVGEGLDGVVRVSCNGSYGTGTLLYGGRAVLTVAHLFSEGVTASQASVLFETSAGSTTLTASKILLHPQHDSANANNDLALVWLSAPAAVTADRYDIYRDSDEIGQTLTLVGYGTVGTGAGGTDSSYSQIKKHMAMNQFDGEAYSLKGIMGEAMGWSPADGAILIADFDNGLSAQDALGNLMGASDLGLGSDEGLIAPGDSGGPAFVDEKLAGVASYTAALYLNEPKPDIDNLSNSSFGEIGFWHRISHYQEWIDESLRAEYPDVPATPGEVKTSVIEGAGSTQYVYFLLQFGGVRTDADAWLSVDYATRNGTAFAGQDYIAAAGTLVLYPGESQALIPVEIIGDTLVEADEILYLDVTNPVGGSFGTGMIQLTAIRTILNDDIA